jgi:hypothetical protein
MHARADRVTVLGIAARANVDPRTVRKYLRGEPILPALARAIDEARALEDGRTAIDRGNAEGAAR